MLWNPLLCSLAVFKKNTAGPNWISTLTNEIKKKGLFECS